MTQTASHSLAMQRQAIEHLIERSERDYPQLTEPLRDAARTIGWLERHQALVREVNRLHERAPEIAELLQTIPGLQIARVT